MALAISCAIAMSEVAFTTPTYIHVVLAGWIVFLE